MKNTNKLRKMKWYNCLVYLLIPLRIFVYLLGIILWGQMFSPVIAALFSFEFEIVPSKITQLLALLYLLIFVFALPLIYNIILRASLKRFKARAPKLVSFWYILLVLLDIGALVFLSLLGENPEMLGFMISATILDVLRALVMIPSNALYFSKRAALFENRHRKRAPKDFDEEFEEDEDFEE